MQQIESFFLGIIAALGALILELIVYISFSSLSGANFNVSFTQIFLFPEFIIIGAFIEELLKYVIVVKVVDLFSFEKSYIVNSLLVGTGFVATEFLLFYYSGNLAAKNILGEIAILHIGTVGIMGYLVATNNPKKFSTFFGTMLLATFFHASYNFLIQNRTSLVNAFIYTLLGFLVLANLFNILRISRKLAQQ